MINDFRGQYRWLSNFHLIPIEYEGIVYPSTEHAYQAAKTLDVEVRKQIAAMPKCVDVKRFGMTVELRPNWDGMRLETMKDILLKKFEDPELRQKLIDTGSTKLVEGNTWGDTFWGICNGKGKNYLGKILMDIRNELSEVCLKAPEGEVSHCVHWWEEETCCWCDSN